ncbi:MAG: hypothetical protein V3T83_18340 [Acidobacteriota bacterium]
MIGWIRIFVWLRIRTLINTAKSGARRDAVSRLSRFAEAAAPILLAVFLIPLAIGLGIAALAGGWWMAGHPDIEKGGRVVRILLGVAMGLVLISPLASAMKGEASTSIRLLLLPIPRRLLHAVQVISGIGDPVVAVVIPGLLALPLGLALGGSLRSGLMAGAASLAFLAVLLALQSLAGSLLQMLYRNRRRAEWFSMALMVSLIGVSLLPPLFMDDSRSKVTIEAPQAPIMQALLGILPSEMYGSVLMLSLQEFALPALSWLAGLLILGLALLALNWIVFRRLLETPESSGSKGDANQQVRIFTLPGLGPGASAVAWATVRSVMRTGRGRLSVFLTPLMVPLLGLVIFSDRNSDTFSELPVEKGLILALMAVGFSLMTNQPVMLNQFGTDRSGLTLQFLSPLSGRELVRGKLAATGLMVGVTALAGMAGALLVEPSGHPALWLACPLVILSGFLLTGPLGTILSIIFPKASNLSHWSKEGNPHPLAALLGTLLLGPALGPPVALAAIGLLFLKSLLWVWILLLAWCGLAAAIFWGLSTVAGSMLDSRREALGLVAQGK